jgi:hypothetical protein
MDPKSEIPKAATGQDGAKTEEDEAPESSRTANSIPPANSQDEKIEGKRKRADDDGDSESSSASKPQLTVPTDSAAPTSGLSIPYNVFDMTLDLSSEVPYIFKLFCCNRYWLYPIIYLHNVIHMDEEEAPEDPAVDQAKSLSAFIKTPSKTLSPREETVNSAKLEEAEETPGRHPRRKSRNTMPTRASRFPRTHIFHRWMT